MLNACIDTLPPDKCKLCGNIGTTNHFLNCCSTMLNTKRYTWRHNNLINFIVINVDKKFRVYSDLPGWEAPGGGSIHPHLCVTKFKPDIVIIDSSGKKLHIFELTCPFTMNICKRNQEKSLKYAPFETDITGFVCSVNRFAISSTGYVNTRNTSTLAKLQTFIRKKHEQVSISK